MINAYSGLDGYAFLSYSHKDIEFVNGLLESLISVGCRVWYDEGILPSNDWAETIALKIASSKLFIVVISANSLDSNYVKREITYAISKNIPILTVFKENVELSPGLELQLSTYQAVKDYRQFKDELYQKKEVLFPKSILGESGKILYRYSNFEYRFFPNKNTFTIIKLNRQTNEKQTLFIKNISKCFDASFGTHSINSAIPFEFHPYKKNTLFFEVFCDLLHNTNSPYDDLYVNYKFAIIEPNSETSKLVLEQCLIKKQAEPYNPNTKMENSEFIKNDLT